MSRTVHGVYVTIIVTVLYCGLCSCLQFNQENVVNKKYNNEFDAESFQVVEPLETNENDVEVIPDDDVIVSNIKNEQEQENNKNADQMITLRKKRQAYQGYTQLYPQLPTGAPYNPYQPQPNYNPSAPNPYSQGPQPWSSTNHTSFGPGHPPQQGYNPNTGFNQNQGTHNYSQPGYPGYPNYNNQHGAVPHNNPPYSPSTNQFGSVNSTYPHSNYNSSSHYPYNPSNGKYPSYNQTSNYPHNAGTYRPPNASYTGYPSRPGVMNSSYPQYPGARPPYQNQYPHNPYNTTSPSRPNQWQPNYPGSNYPTSNNSYHSNIPNRNSSFGQYPHNPYSNNASHSRPNQWQPNYPGSNGQYPTNTNMNPYNPSPNAPRNSTFGNPNLAPYGNTAQNQYQPNYPGSNGQYPSNTNMNPGYPQPNSNSPQNNFYYPQANNSAYDDPLKVPPHKFAYH